ncbi:hypothetical protein Pla175_02110 [Pirellulimonas nuda]|uniref:Uncharacterized protein n=1 Tax=Pirellulimonas nuda TaxID=2528009 RepID=A0A518D5W2_9BACT|nr:hypothetical protein [Pirellulimonas nuda]QDU86858.1 hypothetical protein Pla175_02110 [Pirellulimonas nuda]
MMRRTASAILDGLTLFWVLLVGPFCWLLRDGLGPDAGESQGVGAVVRFLLTFYWGPVAVALLAARLVLRGRSGQPASEAKAEAAP